MRLIDADALHDALESGPELYVSDVFIVAGTIDAAPTVCCEECANEQDCAVPRAYREYWNAGGQMDETVGCACFERREP